MINTELSIRRPRQLTGTLITFRDNYIYNTRDNPGTGDFSANYANANFGVVQKIYHLDSVVPQFPASWIPVTDSTYLVDDLNILYVEYIGNDQAEYWWARASEVSSEFEGIEITDAALGIIIPDSDGEKWRITIDTTGNLTSTQI